MISVITPVYNGRRFMEFCIQNVIEQHCPEAEHVIVDGGSTDGTVEIIKKYAEKYPHIRWVSEKDKGQSDAMNKGIAMTKGDILSFLNVDDFYEPGALNRAIAVLALLPEPSLLVGNCNMWGDDGKIQGVNKPAHLKLTQLLVGDESRYPFPINPSAYFYHKSLHDRIGSYDIDRQYVMDLDFLLRAVRSAAEVRYVDEVFGNFRYIEGTKTFQDAKTGQGAIRFEKLVKKYRDELSFRQRWQLTLDHFFYKIVRSIGDIKGTLLRFILVIMRKIGCKS
jgi:glycosyltransferase involved in cell wall biosynthesis